MASKKQLQLKDLMLKTQKTKVVNSHLRTMISLEDAYLQEMDLLQQKWVQKKKQQAEKTQATKNEIY